MTMEMQSGKLERKFISKSKIYAFFQRENKVEENEYKLLSLELKELFLELQKFSISENYFWDYCSFKTYESTLMERARRRLEAENIKIHSYLKFFKKDLRDLERKNVKDNSLIHDIPYLIKYGAFGYFDEDTRELIVIDYLSKESYRDIRIQEERKVEFIQQLISNEESGVSSLNQESKSGFNNNYTDEQIINLFNQLKDKYKYIDNNTDLENFKAIFDNNQLPEDFKKINWIKAINLLALFIDEFFSDSENLKWAKAKNCFEKANNLIQAKLNYIKNKSKLPKKPEGISSLLKNI